MSLAAASAGFHGLVAVSAVILPTRKGGEQGQAKAEGEAEAEAEAATRLRHWVSERQATQPQKLSKQVRPEALFYLRAKLP